MPIELVIVTPQGEIWRGPVEAAVLPGSEGDFGVLPNHERFLTPLRVGAVEIRTATETLVAAVAEGFADVTGDEVAVLVEACEFASQIDRERAQAALERAERELSEIDRGGDESRRVECESALQRARNRVAVGERG